MPVLGGSILNRALAVVGSDCVSLLRFKSRAANSVGIMVATYAAPVSIRAQVQAVPHAQFAYLGLDFEKNYIRIYTTTPINDLQRDAEADRFIYGGATYEVVSNEDWIKPQGFVGVLAVRVQ